MLTKRHLILLLVLSCFFYGSSRAHVEGVLFIEHPPKTAFGILASTSWLEMNNNQLAFYSAPFVEYAPSPYLSIGAGIPNGWFDNRYLFSDMVVAAKTMVPLENFMVVPMVSLELPTGKEPATSGHTEFVSAVFLEKKFPNVHLYGYPGARFPLGTEDDGDGHDHGPDVNVFSPHAEKELFANIGVSYWFTDQFGMDGRTTVYYEDFNEVVPEFQIGAVLQINKNDNLTLKGSLSASYVPDGIRQGSGISASFYVGL